jgi:hypothetical protein
LRYVVKSALTVPFMSLRVSRSPVATDSINHLVGVVLDIDAFLVTVKPPGVGLIDQA